MTKFSSIMVSLPAILQKGRLLALLFCFGVTMQLDAQKIYALSGNSLISFNAATPGALTGNVNVSGISIGQTLSGLDFRPNTGQLYALGYNQSTGEARLYTIDLATAVATPVGSGPVVLKANLGKIGLDFNPTVDRIRVTGSNNANYRLHPVTGALVATDGDLAFAAGDANAGVNPSIGAVAYTNSYIGSTSTILYNFDDSLNVLTTQVPPNNGTLNTIGSAGISVNLADQSSDVDIYFNPSSALNVAYLAANTGSQSADNLYSLNLNSGAATLIGQIGNGLPVSDIAVFIDRSVPSTLSGRLVYALTGNNNLITFDSGLPGTVRSLVAISGIATGQTLSGLDVRPATGELIGLGYNTLNGEANLYAINPASGVATQIGTSPIALKPNMGKISMDFNPTVDRVRVTGSDNSNYRLNPVTGTLAATDLNLGFAATDVNTGKNPSVGAGAYTNSFPGSTSTTLYNYDDSLNVLTTQIPPNNGTLNTIGQSGIAVNLADPSSDLDIAFSQFGNPNTAFLSANVGSSTFDNLYRVNLSNGAATLVGKIGNGIAINDIAVAQLPIETGCDVKTNDCVKFELLSITRNADGEKTYRISVTNNCTDNLVYVAFQLPNGVTAEAPANNSVFNSAGGRAYDVRNPSFSPFYSVRFKDQTNTGIAAGQSDLFVYTLPGVANPSYIHVAARVGLNLREAYLNVFGCTVAVSSQIQDRDEPVTATLVADHVRVYPNPAGSHLFIDLPEWENQYIQMRLINLQGQVVLSTSLQGAMNGQFVPLTDVPTGMYFLELNPDQGDKIVKKVMVSRN